MNIPTSLLEKFKTLPNCANHTVSWIGSFLVFSFDDFLTEQL